MALTVESTAQFQLCWLKFICIYCILSVKMGRKWKNENTDIVARTQYLLVNSLTFTSKEMQLRPKKTKNQFLC